MFEEKPPPPNIWSYENKRVDCLYFWELPLPNIHLGENKRVDFFVEDKLYTVNSVESIYSRKNQLRQIYGRITINRLTLCFFLKKRQICQIYAHLKINGLTLYIWRKNSTQTGVFQELGLITAARNNNWLVPQLILIWESYIQYAAPLCKCVYCVSTTSFWHW